MLSADDARDAPIELSRDCDAVQVPYGNPMTARAGTRAVVMQRLGDSITLRTDQGYMLRISANDADAAGLPPHVPDAHTHSGPWDSPQLFEVLKSCYDPEIPANIVDLGLIYRAEPTTLPNGEQKVLVQMTLTAPGCGMGQVLQDDVYRKLAGLPNIAQVEVQLTFDPPWDATMMSESARLQLGMM